LRDLSGGNTGKVFRGIRLADGEETYRISLEKLLRHLEINLHGEGSREGKTFPKRKGRGEGGFRGKSTRGYEIKRGKAKEGMEG